MKPTLSEASVDQIAGTFSTAERRLKIKTAYVALSRLVGPDLASLYIQDEWMQAFDRRLKAIERWCEPYEEDGTKG